MSQKRMLFIQGKDKPGIIAEASKILFQSGANLEDLSMTILDGQFAMMVSFNQKSKTTKKIEDEFFKLKKSPFNLQINLVSFGYKKVPKSKYKSSLLISAISKDRTGIVYQLSSELSKIKANIINLDCRLLGRSKKTQLYSMALEVQFQTKASEKKVIQSIKKWEKKLGIEIKTHLSEAAIF